MAGDWFSDGDSNGGVDTDTDADMPIPKESPPPQTAEYTLALLQTLRALPVQAIKARRSVAVATTTVIPSAAPQHVPCTATVVDSDTDQDADGDHGRPASAPQGHERPAAVPQRAWTAAWQALLRLRLRLRRPGDEGG